VFQRGRSEARVPGFSLDGQSFKKQVNPIRNLRYIGDGIMAQAAWGAAISWQTVTDLTADDDLRESREGLLMCFRRCVRLAIVQLRAKEEN